MNSYIRDFLVTEIKTETLVSCEECNEVNKINEKTQILKFSILIYVCYLEKFTIKPDCIVLTETWKILDIELYNIQGYNIIYSESMYNQNDGTVVYIKSDIMFSHEIIALSNNNLLRIDIKHLEKKICVLAMYRPPSTCPYAFIQDLRNSLLNINLHDMDYVMFVGDINIDILNMTDSTIEYLNVLHEFGFTSTINGPTRYGDTSRSCIDHIFVKTESNLELLLPIIINTTLTDHHFIYLQIMIEDTNTYNNIEHTVIEKIDHNKLKKRLERINWTDIYEQEEVEAAINRFINVIDMHIKRCMYTIKPKHKKRKLWITNGIITSINIRDKMYHQLLKDPNNVELKERYKRYRNDLNILIKTTKIEYYKNKIDNNKKRSKIKELCKNKKQNDKISNVKKDDQSLTDPKVISNAFNEHYASIGKKLAREIKQNPNHNKQRTETITHSLFLRPTDPVEIGDTIMALKLLTINFEKTHYLPLGSRKNSLPLFQNLTISNNFIISSVENIKYLGIIIDSHLKWDKHVNYVVNKLQSLLYKIKLLSKILDNTSLKTIYYTLVETHISYGLLVWGSYKRRY
ncbi:hypothetical protein NQ317_013406 [Molorchus minor]|uniref:Endonuclease/exonuclease/phosphatase domain-containing protein n=1 Tax=Molorchus minor TaxID=1323400 RepID=A0ABQ9JBP8_9CUCU|nr:hypothetical protein NQ317_013406 [Molorchus minor]